MVPAIFAPHLAKKVTFSRSLAVFSKARCLVLLWQGGDQRSCEQEYSLTVLQQERERSPDKSPPERGFPGREWGSTAYSSLLSSFPSSHVPLLCFLPPFKSFPSWSSSVPPALHPSFSPARWRRRTQRVVRVNLGSSI